MRPNILTIVVDQQRLDCIGYSDKYPVKTPNIDELARSGAWFNHAFTPIPICSPARQAFLNGRRPESFGSLWNYGISLEIPSLLPEEYSWTKELKEEGYKSSFIGKWGINPKHGPLDYGFQSYVDIDSYWSWRKEKYPDIEYKEGWGGEVDPIPYEDNISHWLAARTIDEMDKLSQEEGAWHIRLDFPGPHLPCRPSEEFAKLYKGEDIEPWPSFDDDFEGKPYIQKQQLYSWEIEDYSWEDWKDTVALYYGTISEIDSAIGMVLKRLEELGLEENTMVIYTSDHGDMCGSHRMLDKHYILYDDVVRVPLIIRYPKLIAENTIVDEFVSHFLDLPPTILEILGLDIPDFFVGRSLINLLKGEKLDDWRTEIVSTYNGQQFGLYTQRMIRDRKYKYIWNTTDVDELYDLEKDPWEMKNLIYEEELKDLLGKMRRKLHKILKAEGDGLVKTLWMENQLLKGRKI